ncbi:hypothetical protein ELY33_02300 [Vreelandella andesensis]|uniref:Uncharacterized protein n=1 Tax=Vreelandella andesensis TaxID=447567 RepID=A0A433KX44_9GAMM|nr:hypothetical protein [Halomonas andesensis]RUR34071.1 hypothetical protein ELY33_02300 [Halomonas andesensis]
MGYQLFYYEDINLPIEARWFLWQWERYTGLHAPIDGTVRALLTHLKMPLRQGQKTLLRLKNEGVIEAIPVAKGRGRPSYRYRVSPTLLSTLKALPNEEPSLSDRIDYISQYDPLAVSLPAKASSKYVAKVTASSAGHEETSTHAESSSQGSTGEYGEKTKIPLSVRQPNLHHSHRRKEQLTRANRWVLMVLLARSEVLGILTDMGLITLQRLTGMSSSQLAGQLKKLKTLGVIAHHQPGQAGKLLGKRMTSIYVLGLSHPLLGKPESNSVKLIFPTPPPSKNAATELNHGLIDALMAYGVSLKYEEILIEKLNKLNAAIAGTKWSDQVDMPAYISNRLKLVEKLEVKLNKNEEVRSHATQLLPPLRHLSSTVCMFTEKCNSSQAEWLRAHVHAEAMQMLSTQWLYLWDDDPLPNAPDALVDPASALRHQLAHHLAKTLHRQLRRHADKHHEIDFDELYYTLTPARDRLGRPSPGWALCGHALHTNGVSYLPDRLIFDTLKFCDLKAYWQTHQQDCLSAINDKPDDSTAVSPEPADQ